MIAAPKVESKNEETQYQIRTRAVVTTELVEGMAELKQQTAQLMAALTQTRWGNGHISTQAVPRNMAADVGTAEEAAIVIWNLTMVWVALARWLRSAVFWQGVWK